jgi:hypothetical protein
MTQLLASPLARHTTELSFGKVRLSAGQVRELANWPGFARIQALDFDDCRISDQGVATLIRSPHLGPLRSLRIRNSSLHSAALQTILSEPRLIHLRELDLSRNQITPGPLELLGKAPFRTELRKLSIWSNKLGDKGISTLSGLDLPALKVLDIGFAEVGAAGIEALVGASWLPQLHELSISKNPLGRSLRTLLRAPLDELKLLDLNFDSLDHSCLKDLAGSPCLANLRELMLCSNSLTGANISTLLRAWKLERVSKIDLSLNDLRDRGAIALANWPGLARLRMLDVGHCDITDTGLRALLTSPHLDRRTELELSGNEASAELEEEIAALAPRILI